MRITTFVLLCSLVAACNSPAEPDDRWAYPEKITFHSGLGVDLSQMTKSPTGLYWQDLKEGTGATAVTCPTAQNPCVSVHYTGWLPDGTVFETSRDEMNQPVQFQLGAGLVIRGWDEGIVGMKVGGKRKLVIPPELAFGRSGKGLVPPLATVVFDIELTWVRP